MKTKMHIRLLPSKGSGWFKQPNRWVIIAILRKRIHGPGWDQLEGYKAILERRSGSDLHIIRKLASIYLEGKN